MENTLEISNISYRKKDEMARNINTPPEILAALAKDKYAKLIVAMNPNAPSEVLETLAEDENIRV